MRSFIKIFLFIMSGVAYAETLSLKNLPLEMCADDNKTVLRLKEQNTSKCILALETPSDDSVKETQAKINLNGRVVTLYQTSVKTEPSLMKVRNKSSMGIKETYIFHNKDKSVEVKLKASVTGTSCTNDNDGSCCGHSYSGFLTVKTKPSRVQLPISYYRGG